MNKTYERLIKECDQRGIDRIKVGELTYVNKLAKKVKRLQEENKRLNNTLDKIIDENIVVRDRLSKAIEYIEKNTEIEHDGDEYGYTEWIEIKPTMQQFIDDLLDILRGEDDDQNKL